MLDLTKWNKIERPGYFGRKRDERIAAYHAKYGKGNWTLAWLIDHTSTFIEGATNTRLTIAVEFEKACIRFYGESYYQYLKDREDDLALIVSYGECIDNALTNIESGCDYTKQESFSTHIQDIAVRNALRLLGRKFEGPKDKILVIRSKDSEGFRFGPGQVPFFEPGWIEQPSLCPKWANKGSVEDFWQSNKWLLVKKEGFW